MYKRYIINLLSILSLNVCGFRYYNWTLAAPLILSLQAFQKNLPKVTDLSMYRQFWMIVNWYIAHHLLSFSLGYRGGLGEGENAKEVRPLVVLAKKGG